MKKLKLRCYCCGESFAGAFALVSQSSSEVDRAFIMKAEHSKRVDGGAVLMVEPTKKPRYTGKAPL